MTVVWNDSLIVDPPEASDAAVREAERALRVRLPAEFLAIARLRQGSRPAPNAVTLPDGSVTAVKNLLHFEEEPGIRNIVHRRFPVMDVLAKGIIPFAEDIGDDLFCFNYRKVPDHPSVAYWSVDTGTVHLAGDFDAFVGMLHD